MSAIRYLALYVPQGVSAPAGTGAQTLPSLNQSGSGTHPFTGTGVQTLPSLNQAGAGSMPFEGTGGQTLPALGQSGAGEQILSGTGVQTLPGLSQAGTGEQRHTGTGASTLSALTQAGVGEQAQSGAGAQTLPSLNQSGTGTHTASGATGTGAQSLPAINQAGVGEQPHGGAAAQILPAISQSGEGILQPSGTAAIILPSIVVAAVAVSTPSAPSQPEGVKSDAGVGRQPELTYVDPWQIYARRKPKPVSKLPDYVESAKRRLKTVHKVLPRSELAVITGQIGALSRSVGLFENKIESAIDRIDVEAALAELDATYRLLEQRSVRIADELTVLEQSIAHRQRLAREDDEIVAILGVIL